MLEEVKVKFINLLPKIYQFVKLKLTFEFCNTSKRYALSPQQGYLPVKQIAGIKISRLLIT